jgi:hypothetical protein
VPKPKEPAKSSSLPLPATPAKVKPEPKLKPKPKLKSNSLPPTKTTYSRRARGGKRPEDWIENHEMYIQQMQDRVSPDRYIRALKRRFGDGEPRALDWSAVGDNGRISSNHQYTTTVTPNTMFFRVRMCSKV